MTYNDLPAKMMIYPAILFMVIGMTFGVYVAFNGFVAPDYFQGEYIHFGRIRPVHVGTVTMLWLLSVNVGLIYYIVPRLAGVPLWSNTLGQLSASLWWPSLIIGIYSYPFGTNFGWEYAELPNSVSYIPVKALFTFAWLLVATNVFMTIANRCFEKMYVSLWYIMGTMIWTTFTYIVGSWLIFAAPAGISRVNLSFFYVHNLVGLVFTPMGLAIAYYALPKLSKKPLYSHRLSMVGFWTIAFVYAWVGAHHIIHGPMTQWLQTVSIIFSIWLFIPVFSVVTNLFMTVADDWEKYTRNAGVRFIIMGTIFYLLTCIQGPLQALRNVNEITSKTDWIVGHSHISLYATFTFFAMGGIYQALPALTGRSLWSERLANWHFSLNLLGSIPFILPLWIGGFLQGVLWSRWADGSNFADYHYQLTQMTFLDTVAFMKPWWHMRLIGGLIVLLANALFAYNVFNTIVLKEPLPQSEGTL